MSVVIRGVKMPTYCDGCWALDDDGDYPRCRITEEQRGYNFPIREKRMDRCPLAPIPHPKLVLQTVAKLLNPNPYGECSRCGCLVDIRGEHNYCPKCGAKLIVEKEVTQ